MKPSIAWINSDWNHNDFRRDNDLYGGIGYYRVYKPASVLREWFDIDVIGSDIRHWGTTDETYTRLGRDYDLIISKNSRTPEEFSNTLGTGKHFKRKVLVDIDDNFLSIRPDNPAYKEYQHGQGNGEFLGAFLSLADGLIVSTKPLKDVYKTLNKKIDILPNCCDVKDWPKPKVWDDGKIRIGFAGGAGHLADLNLILEPLAYILAKYPNVLLEIVGAIGRLETAITLAGAMNDFCKKDVSAQIRVAGGTQAWQGYPEMLAGFGWDIVLAPSVDDSFNQCKSHNRWMESAMIGCPVVASPVYPYSADIQGVKTIQHETTGLLANNKEQWFEYLEGLILAPEIRKLIAENAYKYIKDNWQYSQWAEKWRKVINKYV